MMDRPQLADFLRRRREALQPEDVGLGAGARRRTQGLRREEVAMLAHMSTDYYARLEQQRGPQPSEQMLAALARGLRLSLDERDHLFRLAGQTPGPRARRTEHVNPALMRVLDRLDTPAQVMSDLGVTLVQNDLAVALVGDQTRHTGLARHLGFRWFTDPAEREIYPAEDHAHHSRVYAAGMRGILARDTTDERALDLVEQLQRHSPEFAALWAEHEIAVNFSERKRLLHPGLGLLELWCQVLINADEGQVLLVYTATPGTESHDKLRLLGLANQGSTLPS
jgi:transcriptional regulator with XRE-family HTH domain